MSESRRRVRWSTKKRKGGSRVWKTRWVAVKRSGKAAPRPAPGKPAPTEKKDAKAKE